MPEVAWREVQGGSTEQAGMTDGVGELQTKKKKLDRRLGEAYLIHLPGYKSTSRIS